MHNTEYGVHERAAKAACNLRSDHCVAEVRQGRSILFRREDLDGQQTNISIWGTVRSQARKSLAWGEAGPRLGISQAWGPAKGPNRKIQDTPEKSSMHY